MEELGHMQVYKGLQRILKTEVVFNEIIYGSKVRRIYSQGILSQELLGVQLVLQEVRLGDHLGLNVRADEPEHVVET